ncbi:MAG: hypothetical protein QOE70_6088 [Chthoniobacter sp.]|jgi:transcriptional antiterminator RfaH|nr:hypothetical protein [Chthoniobacter sp.]
MTYSAAQLSQIDVPLWFCLKAQPKQEHLAAMGLRRQLQIECYSPRLRFRKPTRRGAVWFVESMFPGYIFANFNYAEQHRRIQSSPGIQCIVRFGELVGALDPAIIAALRENTGDEEIVTIDPQLKVGQSVQITEGAFQGLEALITQVLPAKERVRVMLEFLGRPVEAEIPSGKILPKISPRLSAP